MFFFCKTKSVWRLQNGIQFLHWKLLPGKKLKFLTRKDAEKMEGHSNSPFGLFMMQLGIGDVIAVDVNNLQCT
jgi:hypothetical protein